MMGGLLTMLGLGSHVIRHRRYLPRWGGARERARRARRGLHAGIMSLCLTLAIVTVCNAQLGDTVTNTSVSCGTSATVVLAANGKRQSVLFVAATGNAVSIFLGGTAGVTTGTGIPIPAGQNFSDSTYIGGWWCIVASGTATLLVAESSR